MQMTNSAKQMFEKSEENKMRNKNVTFNMQNDLNELVKTVNKQYHPEDFKEQRNSTKLRFDSKDNTEKLLRNLRKMQEGEIEFVKYAKQKCDSCIIKN